jgi:Flp pilus assembly protein TadD
VEALAKAAGLAPDDARYAYVYGVSLHALGDRSGGLDVLARAHQRHPQNGELLAALATMHRDEGNREQALKYALLLAEVTPGDPEVQTLIEELRNPVPEDG